MNSRDFENAVQEQIRACVSVLSNKAEEYANQSVDRLEHFKIAAALQGCTPEAALAGMMSKHLVSVMKMCSDAAGETSMGLWREKITDSINYLLILSAMESNRLERAGCDDAEY